MKKIIWMFLAIALPMMFTACNDDDENGSKTPEFKGTVFNAAIGEGYSSRNYSVELTDSTTKETLALDMYCEGYKYLPSATYTIVSTPSDSIKNYVSNSSVNYTYYKKDSTTAAVKVLSGTITVTSDLITKKYTIIADVIVDDSAHTNFKGMYVGEIEGKNMAIFDELTITPSACKRLEIDNPVDGECYLKLNDADWNSEMAMAFVCDKNAKELTPGTYMLDSTDVAGTLRSSVSYIDYYPNYDLGGHFKSGKAEVTKSGDNYAIKFDLTTTDGQRFVGEFNGEVSGMDLAN